MKVAELAGLWTRSLLRTPEGEDTSTQVAWLQGPSLFADLRQKPGRPDFSHVAKLENLSWEDCRWLAGQQGFAGVFALRESVFWWQREIDYQPPGPAPDAGTLVLEEGVLIETGHFAPYLEHWHLAHGAAAPCGALRLRRLSDGRAAILVRAGADFMFARERGLAVHGASLAEAMEGATLAEAQALLDCEISRGNAATWEITHSTLPYREGSVFSLDGWEILQREGETGL